MKISNLIMLGIGGVLGYAAVKYVRKKNHEITLDSEKIKDDLKEMRKKVLDGEDQDPVVSNEDIVAGLSKDELEDSGIYIFKAAGNSSEENIKGEAPSDVEPPTEEERKKETEKNVKLEVNA